MSAFVLSKRPDGKYKFKFVSRKGKTIFTSLPFKQKTDCELIIASVQNHISFFTVTKMKDSSGKYLFRLSKQGLVLATSRKFSTELMLKKGIDQIFKYIPTAETLDFSEDELIFSDADSVTEKQD